MDTVCVDMLQAARVEGFTGSLYKAVMLQPEAMRKMRVVAKNLGRANYPPLHARALRTGIMA